MQVFHEMGDKKDSVETKKQIEELKQWVDRQQDVSKEIGELN